MSENFIGAMNHFLNTKYGGNRSKMAADMGFSPQQVAGWVAGKTTPKPENLVVIAEKLGMPADELLHGKGFLRPDPLLKRIEEIERRLAAIEAVPVKNSDPLMNEIMGHLATASDEKKRAVLSIIKTFMEG